MKHASRITLLPVLAGVLFGCTQDANGPAPAGFDAGLDPDDAHATAPFDAAPRDDASDAGSVADARLDAGSPDMDASRPNGDASAPPPDASDDAGSAPTRARVALVVPASWQEVDAGMDPFADRPSVTHCTPNAIMAELLGGEAAFSVNTGQCDYLTVTQPTRAAASAGDVLKLRLWHFDLSAPEPAEAHAVVQLDGLTLLDERIPIPQPGGLIARQLKLERTLPAGTPVYFHLHNHGANSWSLVEISAGP